MDHLVIGEYYNFSNHHHQIVIFICQMHTNNYLNTSDKTLNKFVSSQVTQWESHNKDQRHWDMGLVKCNSTGRLYHIHHKHSVYLKGCSFT